MLKKEGGKVNSITGKEFLPDAGECLLSASGLNTTTEPDMVSSFGRTGSSWAGL